MNKKLTQRLFAAFTVAMLFSLGAMAQTAIPGYDDGVGGNNYETLGETWVIEGGTVPLYAQPDGFYHPSYNPIDGSGLNVAGFTWTWTSADAPANITFGSAADNYVEISGVNAGDYTVNVLETAPAAFGGCDDGTGVDITIHVVAEPSIAFDAASIDATDCEGGTFPAAITAVISGGYQAYRLAWNLEIKTLNGDGTDKAFYDTDKTTTPTALAESYTQAIPEAVASSGNHTITSVAGGFTVIDNSTTVYTYTLQGLNDQASRWSDFTGLADVNTAVAGNYSYFDTVDDVVTITVYPTPTTGPIYHISSGWAN